MKMKISFFYLHPGCKFYKFIEKSIFFYNIFVCATWYCYVHFVKKFRLSLLTERVLVFKKSGGPYVLLSSILNVKNVTNRTNVYLYIMFTYVYICLHGFVVLVDFKEGIKIHICACISVRVIWK